MFSLPSRTSCVNHLSSACFAEARPSPSWCTGTCVRARANERANKFATPKGAVNVPLSSRTPDLIIPCVTQVRNQWLRLYLCCDDPSAAVSPANLSWNPRVSSSQRRIVSPRRTRRGRFFGREGRATEWPIRELDSLAKICETFLECHFELFEFQLLQPQTLQIIPFPDYSSYILLTFLLILRCTFSLYIAKYSKILKFLLRYCNLKIF